jgi:carboxymethylenebutenolidase
MERIIHEEISLNISDGTSMAAYAARPEVKGEFPGIIVFQEAFGVNSHIRDITDRFAHEGFIAVAPELFHRTAHGFEGNYNDFDGVRKHVHAVTIEGLSADIIAVNEWLKNDAMLLKDQIVAIGFCMGGRVSFLANSLLDLKASVSFYGGGIDSTLLDKTPGISAPVLLCWGGKDTHILKENRNKVTDALEQNNKSFVNAVFSEAGHGFNCDQRDGYNPDAAKQAWALSKSFINTYITV